MSAVRKKILFRLNKPPYGTSHAREALDAILAAAAFEQEVSVLFCGDGVYQLLPNQAPGLIGQKHFTAAFGLFSMYGIDRIFVEAEALRERQLKDRFLSLPAKPVERADLIKLLRQQHQILSF